MNLFTVPINLPFSDSASFVQSLPEAEAIDFFFAKQILSSITENAGEVLVDNLLIVKLLDKLELGFFLLVALSCEQRKGSLCLHLGEIADKTLWSPQSEKPLTNNTSFDDNLSQKLTGFRFPCLDELTELSEILVECCPTNTYLHFQQGNLYSRRYFVYEKRFCDFINSRIDNSATQNLIETRSRQREQIQHLLALLFDKPVVDGDNIDLQQLATINSLCHYFSIITGGAGTGKTYTITRLLLALSVLDNIPPENIALLAPTGKAANRLKQSMFDELEKLPESSIIDKTRASLYAIRPQTIHNLLKIDPIRGQSKYSELNPLQLDVVIVDESSMVDISLMDKIICALPGHATLILIGDANQLPSVETGSLLADLVAIPAGLLTTKRFKQIVNIVPQLSKASEQQLSDMGLLLTEVNSESSISRGWVSRLIDGKRSHGSINKLSQAILRGDQKAVQACFLLPEISYFENALDQPLISGLSTNNKQFIDPVLNPALGQRLLDCFSDLLQANSPSAAFSALAQFNLLTPYRRGKWGVESLNVEIEGLLAQKFSQVIVSGFYPGKPIMVLANDYQLGLFNGDVGVIWPDASGQLKAYFIKATNKLESKTSDQIQHDPIPSFDIYPLYSLPKFETTYAMTIHKTQGSEYNHIELIMPESETGFLNRQLVYTAVTRAKNSIGIWSQKNTFKQAIEKDINRVSGVSTRIA